VEEAFGQIDENRANIVTTFPDNIWHILYTREVGASDILIYIYPSGFLYSFCFGL
jgi:hypothetical protein